MGKFMRKGRDERRSEILEAARRVFLEKGFRNTTMEDVIAETSLSKGGFYHYFKDTASILAAIMEAESESTMDWQYGLFSGDSPEAAAKSLARAFKLRILRENPGKDLFSMFLFEAVYSPGVWKRYLEIEEKAFAGLDERFSSSLSVLKGIIKDERFLFLTRLCAGLILVYRIFPNRPMMERYADYLERMFASVLLDAAADASKRKPAE